MKSTPGLIVDVILHQTPSQLNNRNYNECTTTNENKCLKQFETPLRCKALYKNWLSTKTATPIKLLKDSWHDNNVMSHASFLSVSGEVASTGYHITTEWMQTYQIILKHSWGKKQTVPKSILTNSECSTCTISLRTIHCRLPPGHCLGALEMLGRIFLGENALVPLPYQNRSIQFW